MTKIRVAMDARRLQDRPPGGVSRALHSAIDHLAAEVDLTLLTDSTREPVATSLRQQPLFRPPGSPETVWLQWSVARWLRTFDGLFHGTFNALPFRAHRPSVVTIYDLSFEIHPEGMSPVRRRVFQINARRAAKTAQRIVTASDHAKAELVVHYGVDPEQIVVAPLAVDPSFNPARATQAQPICDRLGIVNPYIVAIGGARRRGLEVAVDAWRRVRAEGVHVDLVVVGAEPGPPQPGLVNVGAIADEEWTVLLAQAAAFCYPTRYEGFGLPALESIASGTPVVCAPVASLPEVLGETAEWCDEPTPAAIADGLRRVLTDDRHAEDLRQRGLIRAAAQISSAESAQLLLNAYREATGE